MSLALDSHPPLFAPALIKPHPHASHPTRISLGESQRLRVERALSHLHSQHYDPYLFRLGSGNLTCSVDETVLRLRRCSIAPHPKDFYIHFRYLILELTLFNCFMVHRDLKLIRGACVYLFAIEIAHSQGKSRASC